MRNTKIIILSLLVNLCSVGCGLFVNSDKPNQTTGTGSGSPAPGSGSGNGNGSGSGNANQTTPPNTDTGPYTGVPYRFMGRITPGIASPNAPQTLSWADSTVMARFMGSQVTVNITRTGNNNLAYFELVVDGKVAATLDPTLSTATASNLSTTTPHEVHLVKRNEAAYGTAQFTGFVLGADGHFLAPPAAPTHRMEFIGDSISNGYGNLGGTNANCSGAYNNEDTTQAYGPVAAAQLNADVMVSAWSGKGVYENDDTTFTNVMPQLWQLTDPTDPTAGNWDFKSYQPDVVVINLGTNDFSNGVIDATTFTTTYLAFLTQVRTNYPNARIYLAIGPMMEGTSRAAALADLQAIVQSAASLPNGNLIALMDFGVQNVDAQGNGAACDYHPTIATAAAMAAQVAATVHKDMQW